MRAWDSGMAKVHSRLPVRVKCAHSPSPPADSTKLEEPTCTLIIHTCKLIIHTTFPLRFRYTVSAGPPRMHPILAHRVSSMPAPLDGIRVIEVANWLAAPPATALMADMGAEVIKVEPPAGDIFRSCNQPAA